MKTHLFHGALVGALFFSSNLLFSAPAAPAAKPAEPELAVVIVDALARGHDRHTDFERISWVFTDVFERQKWPLKINVERFAANSPAHPIELRVFYQGIRRETPDQVNFRAWMVLNDHGTKTDFGIVQFRYSPRPIQNEDDVLEAVVRGAAQVAAEKIDAVLFPKTEAAKP